MADGKKLFDFFELARQENGRFVVQVDHIDEYTTIRGLAARGTLDSSSAWLLEKTRVVGGVIVLLEYADNANFTQVWNDRLLSFTSGNGTGGASNLFMPPSRIFDSDGQPFTLTGGGLPVSDVIDTLVHASVSVGTTEVEAKVGGTPLADRKFVRIFNPAASTEDLHYGVTGVSTANSEPVLPGGAVSIPATADENVFMIRSSATEAAIVYEGS